MVQVLSCHHFKSQTVVSPDDEPLVIFASGSWLFVATSQRVIEVYKLDGAECSLLHSVKTLGVAWKGTYNRFGNYIAVLEDEVDRSNTLRVYFNWDQNVKQSVTRARIAGSGSPMRYSRDDAAAPPRGLEVVEVRTKRHVLCMESCSETGNFVVGMKGIISVFRLVLCASQHDFQHFMDIVADDFKTINIALHGAHLAFTSSHEAHVLLLNSRKFHINSFPTHSADVAFSDLKSETACKTDVASSHHVASLETTDVPLHSQSPDSCVVTDKHYVEWTFGPNKTRTRLDLNQSEQKGRNRILLPSIQDEEYVKQKEGPAEILGPVSGIPGISPFKVRHAEKAKMGKRPNPEKIPSYIHLLYCRFPETEASLMSLQLLPTYVKGSPSPSANSTAQASPAQTSQSHKLSGMCCLLSTPRQGLMYDIMGPACPLSCYLYTGEAISIKAGQDFVYAVTLSGLETYSHRLAAAAVCKIENMDGEFNACPDATTDICLMGLRPFLSVETVTSCDNHVILMGKAHNDASSDTESKDWSVYMLQKAPISDLHGDMIELAGGFRHASFSAYQHLITEAHFLVRSKLLQCCHGNSDSAANCDACAEMKGLFQETNALLGQIHAQSTTPSEWPLTLPYLRMSQWSVTDIMKAITGPLDQPYIPEDMSLGPGLAHYLDNSLFSDNTEDLKMDKMAVERIIDVYCHMSPLQCSRMFLSSKYRVHLHPQKRLEVLQNLKQQQSQNSYQWSSADNIAMTLIHLELGEMEQAKFAVSCLTPEEVTQLIPHNSDLVLDESKRLTHFARLLCKEAVDSMVEVLLCILDNNQLTLQEACHIIKEVNTDATGSNLLLPRFLESVMSAAKWQHHFPQAMREIVPIYLGQLHEAQPSMNTSRACRRTHAHVPQGNGCFASRHNWLNKLPPFQGSLRQTCTSLEQRARSWRLQRGRSGSVTQPQTPSKRGASCPCCCCNEVLMRLQSILCSDHLSEEVASYVISKADEMKEVRGRGSLHLLCQKKLDPKAALTVVVLEYPNIAVEFSSHVCDRDHDLWSHILSDLVKGLEEKTADGMETRKAVSLQMLSGVLSYLVQELEASSLLALLPSNLPLALTMPYMERSLLRDRARRLREEVVAAGVDIV